MARHRKNKTNAFSYGYALIRGNKGTTVSILKEKGGKSNP